MPKLAIHRGTRQIGGCTEITCGGDRILINLGANLTDFDALIRDGELIAKVFGFRLDDAVLFTHYPGDPYGLSKKVLKDIPKVCLKTSTVSILQNRT